MTGGMLLAAWTSDPVYVVVRGLAVAGGAAVGAVLTGLLVQLLSRALTAKKLPPWPVRMFRVLGGLGAGLLVALWLFGGGGGGIGGPGGFGFGGGAGPGTDSAVKKTEREKKDRPPPTEKRKQEKEKPPEEGTVLRLEVLTDPAAEKRAGSEAVRQQRYFHLEGTADGALLTLGQVQDLIGKRTKEKPPLTRLDVVTGKDSPDPEGDRVRPLTDWARDQGLTVATPPR